MPPPLISIHAPLAGCDARSVRSAPPLRCHFNPRTPCGVRRCWQYGCPQPKNFNPRTPCGVRPRAARPARPSARFQSTHPLRGATRERAHSSTRTTYFNPRTPCGVRLSAAGQLCDRQRHFNPRTPCGVRLIRSRASPGSAKFQSTHPLRGATDDDRRVQSHTPISIHAPLAGCDLVSAAVDLGGDAISIHAPLAGCDRTPASMSRPTTRFQSTHPLRGATLVQSSPVCPFRIFQSTHPLRGATVCDCQRRSPLRNFNPRTPCGVRLWRHRSFSSKRLISIHAPLAGCDLESSTIEKTSIYFNPRTPCGVRRLALLLQAQTQNISIHAPLAGCDARTASTGLSTLPFQSTHPLRGATTTCTKRRRDRLYFNPRTPCGVRQQKRTKNAALLRKRYKYKFFVCKKCTSGDLTGAYSSKNTLYSGANCSENPCALSVRTHRISGPSTSNPGLMPKCSILERYFSPR